MWAFTKAVNFKTLSERLISREVKRVQYLSTSDTERRNPCLPCRGRALSKHTLSTGIIFVICEFNKQVIRFLSELLYMYLLDTIICLLILSMHMERWWGRKTNVKKDAENGDVAGLLATILCILHSFGATSYHRKYIVDAQRIISFLFSEFTLPYIF